MMLMDDPKITDTETEPMESNLLCHGVYNSLEWNDFDVCLV